MTLTRFVTKNAFRNKRRSILTVLSIGFSLLLLTLMMTIWQAFYLDQGSARIGPAAGSPPPRFPDFCSAHLLSRENSRDPRSGGGCARFLVWRHVQRPEAGKLLRAVRHRSG